MEVMMGTILLSFFVIGVSEFWSVLKGRLARNTIRQQAVFVLHGQMERLSAIYRISDGSYQIYDHTSGYNTHHPDSAHSILTDSANGLVTDRANDFVLGLVFYSDQGMSGHSSSDRNVVWIDRDHGVAGYLSWVLTDFAQANCFTGVHCQVLQLYLDYPYWVEISGHVLQLRPFPDGIDTLRLDTLIGKWS
ncbi:MAG: hypothetical protein HQL85_08910 [Magnetococcales bacterium]|nr:hypothetical protein [Magnetococcales bacterium]